jgi:two-component sensor histidine kinase
MLTILFASGIFSSSRAQTVINDPQKLLTLIKSSHPDSSYIGWLLDLSYYYFLNNGRQNKGIDSALIFANQAEALSLQLKYPKGLGNSYIALSRASGKTQQKEKGKEYVNRAIKIFADNHLFTDLGFAFWEMAGFYNTSPTEFSEKIDAITKSVNAFHQAGNKKKEADALKELADVRQIYGDYPQSIDELKQALRLYQSINEPVPQGIYDLMGDVSCSLGNLNDAVHYGLLAVEGAEKVKDTTLQMCTICNHLGITYYYLKDYPSSAFYYKKALAVAEKYQAYNDIYLVSYNYGNNLKKMNRPAECNELLSTILRKYPNIDTPTLIHYICSFVSNYTQLKRFPEAEKYFNQLASLVQITHLNNETQRGVYISTINYLLASGQNKAARHYLEAAEKFLTKSSSLILLAGNQLSWADLDSATGDYRSAFGHFRNYTRLKDSIYNQEKSRYVTQLSIQYETAKKDQDIVLKQKDIEILEQKDKIQRRDLLWANQTRNWILGASVLMLVLLGVLINFVRLKLRTNRKLQAQQKEIERKNEALMHLVREKDWLVKEIHHRVKNNFHIVQGLLGTQSGYLKSEEAINALADSRHRVQAMSLIHQKLYQADNLSAINMPGYVHELVNYLSASFNVGHFIQFKLDIAQVDFELTYCIPLGLIMNEAITNSIKYAFPNGQRGVIMISLQQKQDRFSLTVIDNGVGLPTDIEVQNATSMGVKLMKGLSEDIDGAFSLTSHPGTEVCVNFVYVPEGDVIRYGDGKSALNIAI